MITLLFHQHLGGVGDLHGSPKDINQTFDLELTISPYSRITARTRSLSQMR